ncbi:hypothetical protein CLOP_g7765 [Closterium sp. NIES-67]|nr:hypothetical protein CLOP_g7765 [Closterium sp. NIES-67]
MPPPPAPALGEGPSPMAVDPADGRGELAEAEGKGSVETEGVANSEGEAGGSRGGRTGGAADGLSLVAVAVDSSGCLVAGAVAGSPHVCLLRFDPAARALQLVQWITLNDGVPPTSLAFSPDGKIWTVAGAAESLPSEDSVVTPEAEAAAAATAARIALAAVARILVLSPAPAAAAAATEGATAGAAGAAADAAGDTTGALRSLNQEDSGSEKYQVLPDGEVPGGNDLLVALQGSVLEDVADAAREAAKGAVDGLWGAMRKKDYGEDERESRKRRRNDKKSKAAN